MRLSPHIHLPGGAGGTGRLPLPVDADPMFVPIVTTMPEMGVAAQPMTSGSITIEAAGRYGLNPARICVGYRMFCAP